MEIVIVSPLPIPPLLLFLYLLLFLLVLLLDNVGFCFFFLPFFTFPKKTPI